jgi:uncharacterized membrane protein
MKTVRLVCCFYLLLVSVLALCLPGIALAQDEEEPLSDVIELGPIYPKIEAIAGADFEFAMEFLYVGGDARVFDLRTTAPKGWDVYMTPKYEKEKKISSIRLEPSFNAGNEIRVVASAPTWPLPEPGEYKITFEAVSDDVRDSTELTAVITAKYFLILVPTLERYDTEAEAGKDNYFAMEAGSLSTAAIDDIKFSPTKPEGWMIEFKPEKIELLEAFDSQTVDINIKPPPDTIAGDYYISVRALGQQATSDEVKIRVTVETSPTWQWVGVGIIVIVVVGVIVIFMRFSRR